jgi:hypothetical protein
MYTLRAYYEVDPERIFHRDFEASGIVGKPIEGAGTALTGDRPMRDLEWTFDSLTEAEAARDELSLSGFEVRLGDRGTVSI